MKMFIALLLTVSTFASSTMTKDTVEFPDTTEQRFHDKCHGLEFDLMNFVWADPEEWGENLTSNAWEKCAVDKVLATNNFSTALTWFRDSNKDVCPVLKNLFKAIIVLEEGDHKANMEYYLAFALNDRCSE